MVGREHRAPVGGDPVRAGHLHPPPAVVEEAEEGLHELGEALVEPPLVLVVVALQPAHGALHGHAGVARERGGPTGHGVRELETRVEALPEAAHEAEGNVEAGGLGHAALTSCRRAIQSCTAATVEYRGSYPTSSSRRRMSTARP